MEQFVDFDRAPGAIHAPNLSVVVPDGVEAELPGRVHEMPKGSFKARELHAEVDVATGITAFKPHRLGNRQASDSPGSNARLREREPFEPAAGVLQDPSDASYLGGSRWNRPAQAVVRSEGCRQLRRAGDDPLGGAPLSLRRLGQCGQEYQPHCGQQDGSPATPSDPMGRREARLRMEDAHFRTCLRSGTFGTPDARRTRPQQPFGSSVAAIRARVSSSTRGPPSPSLSGRSSTTAICRATPQSATAG